VLLYGGRGKLPLQVFDEGGDVDGLYVGELADAAAVAPFREAAGCVQVRLAGVVVVDLGGEEFQDAPGGLRRRREKRRGLKLGARGEDDFGGHGVVCHRVL
jgi:hypothetical protein